MKSIGVSITEKSRVHCNKLSSKEKLKLLGRGIKLIYATKSKKRRTVLS